MSDRTVLLFLACAAWACAALADPPSHAPAHGWRKKNDPYYVGYTGTQWERDYDVTSGRCNREAIGAVLGGVAGGAMGSQVSSPEHRTAATIIGAIAGAWLGARIGRELDGADRACFGHSLEIAKPGAPVRWQNPDTGVSYVIVAGGDRKIRGKACRQFELSASRNSVKEKRSGVACPTGAGVWNILQ